MEKNITESIRAYVVALRKYPETLHGQQDHFSSVVPGLEAELREALTDEFSPFELSDLRDFLNIILEEQ